MLQFGTTYIVNQASLTRARSASWRQAGISLRPWTVDTVKGWKRMAYDKASADRDQPAGRLPRLGAAPLPLTSATFGQRTALGTAPPYRRSRRA